MKRTIFFAILLGLLSCKSTKVGMSSEFNMHDESINLYAFIGEKISIMEFDPNEDNVELIIDTISGDTIRKVIYSMDYGFRNKYKVMKNVFNVLKTDTIEFVSYDHYGRPGFENYKNVLLYLSYDKNTGQYYHQKYLFDPVKRTKNNSWKGKKGRSIESLFMEKKEGVLTSRKVFK